MCYEMRLFGRWLQSAAIAADCVLLLSVTVADDAQAAALRQTFSLLAGGTVLWFLTGPVWVAFGRKKESDDRPEPATQRTNSPR